MNEEKLRQEVLRQLYELAFGRSNDPVKLAFLAEDEAYVVDGLDLRQLAGVHRLSNGSVEIKLADRAKLVELLLKATEAGAEEAPGEGFVAALSRTAERLGAAGEAGDGDGGDI